jgi:lactate dehydrogenase-like 2-hydroxyacid dehydrogenase
MKVVYYNRHRVAPAIEKELGAKYVPLDRLLATSDFVSLNVPYAKETHHMIGAKELAKMKPTAVLVNSARGGIVDDAALIEALKARQIAAAGLDVYEGEPKLNPGFLTLDNVVLAPHIGSASQATRMKMVRLAVKNLTAILSGQRPPSLLNPEVWANRRR